MLWDIGRHGDVLGTLGVYWSPLGHWRTLESWRCQGLLGALEVLDSAGGSGVSWEPWGLLETLGGTGMLLGPMWSTGMYWEHWVYWNCWGAL